MESVDTRVALGASEGSDRNILGRALRDEVLVIAGGIEGGEVAQQGSIVNAALSFDDDTRHRLDRNAAGPHRTLDGLQMRAGYGHGDFLDVVGLLLCGGPLEFRPSFHVRLLAGRYDRRTM